MSSTDVVTHHVENRIAWLKFNRPDKRNAMSPPLNRAMLKALEELEFREDVGVLVLTGEGSAWSAGMDLKEYFRETDKAQADYDGHHIQVYVSNFSQSYGWLAERKLVYGEEPHQYRFADIVDSATRI